jgi:hypothetical protein
MVLVVTVDPNHVDSRGAGAEVDVVEPRVLPPGPKPEVAELEKDRTAVASCSFTGDLSPTFVAVPVTSEHHPPKRLFEAWAGSMGIRLAMSFGHVYIMSNASVIGSRFRLRRLLYRLEASPCSSAG